MPHALFIDSKNITFNIFLPIRFVDSTWLLLLYSRIYCHGNFMICIHLYYDKNEPKVELLSKYEQKLFKTHHLISLYQDYRNVACELAIMCLISGFRTVASLCPLDLCTILCCLVDSWPWDLSDWTNSHRHTASYLAAAKWCNEQLARHKCLPI